MTYTISFILRIHGDYHERRVIECTAKQLQATLTRLSKNRNVRDIYWSKDETREQGAPELIKCQ